MGIGAVYGENYRSYRKPLTRRGRFREIRVPEVVIMP
jgi:hypothetical protein